MSQGLLKIVLLLLILIIVIRVNYCYHSSFFIALFLQLLAKRGLVLVLEKMAKKTMILGINCQFLKMKEVLWGSCNQSPYFLMIQNVPVLKENYYQDGRNVRCFEGLQWAARLLPLQEWMDRDFICQLELTRKMKHPQLTQRWKHHLFFTVKDTLVINDCPQFIFFFGANCNHCK